MGDLRQLNLTVICLSGNIIPYQAHCLPPSSNCSYTFTLASRTAISDCKFGMAVHSINSGFFFCECWRNRSGLFYFLKKTILRLVTRVCLWTDLNKLSFGLISISIKYCLRSCSIVRTHCSALFLNASCWPSVGSNHSRISGATPGSSRRYSLRTSRNSSLISSHSSTFSFTNSINVFFFLKEWILAKNL